RFAQTSSHLIQKTSTILLIFIRRTNEQPYDFMKKWACFSIFEVNLENALHSLRKGLTQKYFLLREN
ncbi:MAG: hypothetical protein J6J37_09410, partial [Bacteroidaceae bacterium]|nr:hypothetical protein [Bacteroidaceae bacterium]